MIIFEEKIVKLANSAMREQPPQINVAGSVLGILANHVRKNLAASEKQFMWMALCSSAAAAAIMIVAIASYYYTAADPAKEISQLISWVIQ